MKSVRPIETLSMPFDCELDLPGSKSEANRALVLAALGQGVTRLERATLGDDVLYMVEGLMALGFEVDVLDAAKGTIEVMGGIADTEDEAEIYCGNAGTVVRFLVSVAALVPGEWTLTGDPYLRRRPISPLLDAWRSLGVEIRDTDGGLPVTVVGGRRQGGRVSLDASRSSQFLSSLLLVGHVLEGGLEIELEGETASADYVALTRDTMARFGIRAGVEGPLYRVAPIRAQSPGLVRIDGDWSAAGAFMVLAELTSGRFLGRNLKDNSRQADRRLPELIAALRGNGDLEIDMAATPDQLMNLAVLAARREGRTRFIGAANLRYKECDRLAITAREFRKAGIEIEEEEDGLVVTGTRKLEPAEFDPEQDHRLAMALSVIGSLHPGFSLRNSRCVAKSYPDFFAHLKRIREKHQAIVVVGMRASGKSRLARELAERLESAVVDTDEVFESKNGSLFDYVAKSGWPAFRRAEAMIIAEEIKPGRILAIGGGSLENPATRDIVVKRGIVIHIDEDLAIIRERIKRDPPRPALTSRGTLEELEEIHERRLPIFKSAARIRVPPGLVTEEQVALVIEELRRLCTW